MISNGWPWARQREAVPRTSSLTVFCIVFADRELAMGGRLRSL